MAKKVSNAKTKAIFSREKNKLVSNDSELYNSARNGKTKNFGGKWLFLAGAAVKTAKTKKYVCVIIKLNFYQE